MTASFIAEAARRISFVALVAVLSGCGAAPPPTFDPTADDTVDRVLRLDNGLVLHALPDPGAPAVTVELWLPAGAMHAPDAAPGVALVEALAAEAAVARALAPLGGRAEAWVQAEAAVLSATVAAAHLRPALDALAAAAQGGATAADRAAAAARAEAMGAAAARDPARAALRRLIGEAWGGHAAARPLFGAADEAAGKVFRAARWRPEGAALVASGATVGFARAAGAAFGGWSGAVKPAGAAAPAVEARVVVDPAPGGAARIGLAWPVTVATPEDAAALDLLARLLVQDAAAPLPAALARAGVAARAEAFVYAPGEAGLVVVLVEGEGAAAADALWDATWRGIEALGQAAPAPGSRARAVDAIDAALRDPRAAGRQALRWPEDADGHAYRAALAARAGEAIAAQARGILRPGAAVAIVTTPVPAERAVEAWAAQLAARAGAGEAAPLPAGVTLAVVPSPRRDRAAIHLQVAAGQATVPDPLLGAAQIAAQALAAPIAGSTPAVTLGPEGLTVAVAVPPARLADAIEALADRVTRPRWTPATVERARAAARAARAVERVDAAARARALAVARAAAARGVMLPEAEAVDAGVEAAPPAGVGAWFDAFVTHAPLRLTVATGEPAPAVARVVAAAFAGDRRPVVMRALRAPAEGEAAAGEARGPVVRAGSGGEAAVARVWPVGPLDDGAYAGVELALALFAEAAAGEGVTVEVELRAGAAGGHARVLVAGAPGPVQAAVTRLDAAIDKLAQVPPTAEALAAAVAPLVGRRAVALRQPEVFAAFVAAQGEGGRSFVGAQALAQWRAAIERARAVEVFEAARAHLPPAARIDVQVAPVEG